ncbi:MAG TPA: hypothetical protein VK536_05440 [Candidatus Limnocylindrales bacterium]|nr:hypothetical protein [Candidatus Limnocylindrales bacterium]
MFRDKLLEALNRSKASGEEDKKTIEAIGKIQRQERLSSEEFLKIYETLWKSGPKVKYQGPDIWRNSEENDK